LVTVIFLLAIAVLLLTVAIVILVRKVVPMLRRIAVVLRVDEEDQLHEHVVDLEPGWRFSETPVTRADAAMIALDAVRSEAAKNPGFLTRGS
jgi:hypothetical protein